MKNKMAQVKEDSKTQKGHTYVQWITAFLANTTLLTYGLQAGWVSPMAKVLQSDLSPTGTAISDYEISWIASSLNLAAVFAVPLYAFIADKYGRRVGVVLIIIPQLLCWVIKLSSANTYTLITARILSGLASGGCFNVIPMYVKEISQDSIRGLLGSLLILCQNIGMLGIYALGAYFDYFTIIWIVIALPIVTLPLVWRAPESPAYLVKMGRVEEAASVIAYLRGLDPSDKSIQNEISCMRNEDLYYKTLPNVSFLSIFKNKAWRRGFILIFAVLTVHALNGNVTIMTYAAAILKASGVTVSPEMQSLSFPAFMIIASFVSMSFIEKYGRKPILIVSLILVAASFASVGSVVLLLEQGVTVPGWIPLVSIIGAVSGYSAGVSSVPYIMMSEMFNFQIRAKFLGILVTYAWFMSFVQLAIYGPISTNFGQYSAFYLFGFINLSGVFLTTLLPETRGKSVEEIEEELIRK